MKKRTPLLSPSSWRQQSLRSGLNAGIAFVLCSVVSTHISAQTVSSFDDEDVFALSPFEVIADNVGYFQANAMSGTRLNSKVEDLAQSITVMTKEQMEDFAMIDVNDVFDYMASTEGTSTYSLFETDRTGAVLDQVSLNPNNANRVRGIGNANTAFNNIGTTGRVPVDPLWMDSLELSRGANANIFGLGLASGTVNQVPATASLLREFTRLSMRGDSYGGWRTSLDVNRFVLKDKLSVRASMAYQHTAFERKPSGENARRFSVQVKAQPFKTTTLSASWYGYKNASVRPNFTTPRDHYTHWLDAGQPAWNPITRLVTLANGEVYGNGYVLGSTTPFTAAPTRWFQTAENRSLFQIGTKDEAPYWTRTRYTNNAAGTTSANTDPYLSGDIGVGLLRTGPSNFYTPAQQPLFNNVARPINDKAIYDWSEINLMGNSKAWDDVDIYLAQLDQIIINTAKQTLAVQLTFMREDSHRKEDQPLGKPSVNSNVGELQVDPNVVNLDGTPNPYFGRPFLRASEPYLQNDLQLWDTARVQAAYRIDFARNEGLSRWIGTHQLLGYYEYKDQQRRRYAYRNTPLGLDHPWQQFYADRNTPLAARTQTGVDPIYPVAPGNYSRVIEQYFVGSTVGGGIEYAPNYFPQGATVPYVWGSSASAMNYHDSAIGWTPSPDRGGSFAHVQNVIKTKGFLLQSNFLNDRLIGTFGFRTDEVFDRNAPFAKLTPDLREYDFKASNVWNSGWRTADGETTSFSIVARPFRDLGFLMSAANSDSKVTRFLAGALSSLTLTYNEADNFVAQGPAFDLYLNPVPNQTGTTKDIGLWMTLFDEKLTVRYTRFDTQQFDLRQEDIWTMAQRVQRLDGTVANDAWNLRKQATEWLGGTPTNAQIAEAIRMPAEQYEGLLVIGANMTYAASQDMQAKGDELEINFNPTRSWTVSASVTKTESINTAVGSEVDDFLAERRGVWETLEDPRFTAADDPNTGTPNALPVGATGHLLWYYIKGAPFNTLAGYHGTNAAVDYVTGNVDAPMSVFRQMIGRPRPQVRKYSAKFNTKFNLSGITDHKILKDISVGGSLRWTSKGSIGFYGRGYDPSLDLRLPENKILELDANRPIYSPAETYVDLFVSYRTKLFNDKIPATFQFNVKNVGESGGRLQAVSAFLDGSAAAYRIVDSRQFILTATFEL
jgi:hypothetical protein